jgi:hypothetical protein
MEQALHWLVGALGVPLINWLKGRFGLAGKAAVWLTLAVSLVLGGHPSSSATSSTGRTLRRRTCWPWSGRCWPPPRWHTSCWGAARLRISCAVISCSARWGCRILHPHFITYEVVRGE